jgi:hypothetical protein
MNRTDVSDRIAAVNPVPHAGLSAAEEIDRDALRRRLAFSERAEPGRRRPVERRRILVAAIGVGCLALACVAAVVVESRSATTVVALGSGPISAGALESWTGVPSPLEPGSPVAHSCTATLGAIPDIPDSPVSVLTSDLRGDVGSVILAQGDYTAWCVGTDRVPMYMLLEAPGFISAPVAPDGIDLGASGGRIPPDGYGFASGHAGPEVESVTLHEDGVDVIATVDNGWWTAWWPSDDESLVVDGTFTLRSADGAVSQISAGDIQRGG